MSEPRLSLRVLGAPLLIGPDGPLSGRATYRRRMALLGILAASRSRLVGRERIVALLWSEHPGDAARRILSEALYVFRKELGEDALTVVGDEVGLNPAVVRTDVAVFHEALEAGDRERAVQAYGGPLLDGFFVDDAPEFERWLDAERDRAARACARALEELAEAADAAGRLVAAVDWWRRLAAHDPYSSRVALRLARALDAAGDRPAALRAAEVHAALLREDMGVAPDPALTAFVEGLRRPPASPSPPPAPPPRALAFAITDAAYPNGAVPAAVLTRVAGVNGTEPPAGKQAVTGDGPAAASTLSPGALGPHPAGGVPAAFAPPSAAGGQDLPMPTTRPAPVHRTPATLPGGERRTGRWRTGARAAGLAGMALGIVLKMPARPEAASPAPSGYDPRRIAVTYFDDLSPDGELQYLARGITHMLIHELSQVPALDVISRGGVRPYRDGSVPFDSIVARLRVGSVVEGSVQRSRDSVFVTVELVDASGAQLESRMLGRPMGDFVDLQRALAEEVAASLRRRLGREIRLAQVQSETRSPRAAELVLRAEQLREDAGALAERRRGPDAASAAALLRRADSLLAVAEREDPRWTRPSVLRGWVALARARATVGPRRRAWLATAARHAESALVREPGSGAALELRGTAGLRTAVEAGGMGSEKRLDDAERDLRAALAAEPELATAWSTLSILLRVRGRFAESDLAARRALAQDAYLDDAAAIRQRLVFGAMSAGDYPRARDECARGHAQFPADWRFVECRLTLLRQDASQPADPALAWQLVADLDRLDPPERARAEQRAYSPLYRRMVAAAVTARAGDADSARAVLARARAEAGDSAGLAASLDYDEAYLRLLLGEREAARVLVGRVWAARPWLRPYLARDPLLREIIPAIQGPAAAAPAPPASAIPASRPD